MQPPLYTFSPFSTFGRFVYWSLCADASKAHPPSSAVTLSAMTLSTMLRPHPFSLPPHAPSPYPPHCPSRPARRNVLAPRRQSPPQAPPHHRPHLQQPPSGPQQPPPPRPNAPYRGGSFHDQAAASTLLRVADRLRECRRNLPRRSTHGLLLQCVLQVPGPGLPRQPRRRFLRLFPLQLCRCTMASRHRCAY